MQPSYRIGIDVGGTNTDAVIMNGREVLAAVKVSTSEDVTGGVRGALEQVLAQSGIASQHISGVMIGTTHFTNAVIERKHLVRTGIIRIGLPATASIPPMADWPEDIKSMIGDASYLIKGGYEFDGREINPLDEEAVIRIAAELQQKGIVCAVVNSVFSPVNDSMERRASELLQQYYPQCDVVMASEVGRVGLLERENAAILNASLRQLSSKTVNAFAQALRECQLDCPFFITQNDGTLMNADFVRRFPVLTFASGPTNSMRGAAFLSGFQDAIVVDVGGTTTDVGLLQKGFPRQSATTVNIGGVRTNFRMPDMLSVGLGGGSLVRGDENDVAIGPDSVGYRISHDARVFGGDILTASDIAVALGRASFGDPAAVASLTPQFLRQAAQVMDQIVQDCVEKTRLSSLPLPVIVVGGGSVLLGPAIGGLETLRPHHYSVANAVGAAIAQVSGEVDKIYSLENITREQAIAEAQAAATARAIEAGARADSIKLIDKEDVPLAYLPGNATRIRLKVVGDLEL
ncbi:hydantoinase/oxoprolinase N-terminal domain-containing protein [Pantoea sp. B65]|uniref:hydantoinase/oxoprolinase N-terminal domain-containing protein n=1 Tax=Pantoea sp. B65 TaxID=2813359 RepID=UPI0039B4C9FD